MAILFFTERIFHLRHAEEMSNSFYSLLSLHKMQLELQLLVSSYIMPTNSLKFPPNFIPKIWILRRNYEWFQNKNRQGQIDSSAMKKWNPFRTPIVLADLGIRLTLSICSWLQKKYNQNWNMIEAKFNFIVFKPTVFIWFIQFLFLDGKNHFVRF